MAPLPTDTPPVSLVSEKVTSAADSRKSASLPEVTAGNIKVDYYPPQSLSGDTVSLSKGVWPSEANRRSGYQTAVPASGYASNGRSLAARGADGTNDKPENTEEGGVGWALTMAALSAVAFVGSLGAYTVIKCRGRNRRARERKALAASQAAVTAASAEPNSQMPTDFHAQAPTESDHPSHGERLKGLLTRKHQEPRRQWYGSQAPTQDTQGIELDVLEQPQISGEYTRLGDSPHIPRK